MTKSIASGFVTIEVAAGNLARIRELMAEFQDLADQRTRLVDTPGHSEAQWEAITFKIESCGYRLLGALQGSLPL